MNPDQNQNDPNNPQQMPAQPVSPTPPDAQQPVQPQPSPAVTPSPAMPGQSEQAAQPGVMPAQSVQPGVVGMPQQPMSPDLGQTPTMTGGTVVGQAGAPQPMGDFTSQPQTGFSSAPFSPKGPKKNLLIAIAALIVVIALGFGAYMFMSKNNSTSNKTNKAASESTSKTTATPLSSLKMATFMDPSTMDGYTKNAASTDKIKVYTKGDCSLQYGITDATTLPGTDLGDIVARQIKALRDQGVTVDGPSAGDALVLKDSSDSKKTYSMPTLIFKASKDQDYVMSYYSAVVFSDGTRAFVTRVCTSKTAPVQPSALSGVQADAQRITVMAQMM